MKTDTERTLKENMEPRDKKYFVVSFLELPHPNIERYVCVPKSWVTLRPEEQSSLVAYPNENPALTRNRIENFEPCDKHWTRYKATVEYITNVYDDADAWIATMYDDGVDDSNKCSNTPGSHLTNTIKSEVPDHDPFVVFDRLQNMKKEEPTSPPAASSSWELFSNYSPSPELNEPEESPQTNPWPDITNPDSKVTLKRTIVSNPDQNNNAKQAKLENTASVHDNSNESDKTLESNINAGEKDLESYIDSFLNELQSFMKAQEVAEKRDEASENNTVTDTASMDTSSSTTSQVPTNSDIDNNNQQPNLPRKPLISVVPDKYLLENRGQTATFGQPNDLRENPIPQPNPATASAAQTLIYLNNRQRELFQAVPNATQSHLQLPVRAPIENRPSKSSNLKFRKIAPKPSSTAQQPINTVQRELESLQTQGEQILLPKNVPQSNSQMPETPTELTGMTNNQNTPRSQRRDLGFIDILKPHYTASNNAQQSINAVQRELESQQTQGEQSLLRKNFPHSNSQMPVTPTGLSGLTNNQNTPRSHPDNLACPETHASRQPSMPDLEKLDSGFSDIPQPQYIAPNISSTAQQPTNAVQQELQSQQTQAERSLLRKDVPQSNSQTPVTPTGLTGMRNNQNTLRSLPDNLASPETHASRQLSMPVFGRRDSGFIDIPKPQYIASNNAQQPINTVQRELESQQTQAELSLLRKDVPQRNSQIPVVPAGCQNIPPRSLPDNLASPETQAPRQLSMPELERRDSGFTDIPSPFSPSDVLFIAESPAPSCVNTEIPENTGATSIGDITRVENQLRRPSQDSNSSANKIQIGGEKGVEYDQGSATAQRPNNSTNMTNSPIVVLNHPQNHMEPLVPLTVEELSNPENQQRPKLPQRKRGRKPNSYVNTSKSIEEVSKQRKNSQEAIIPPPLKQECSKAGKLKSEPAIDNNLTLLVKGYLLEDPDSGVIFVQPCPGQNILEPRRGILNPIKQECIENTTSNQACCNQRTQELHRQHSHSQGQYQERRINVNGTYIPGPEIGPQNIQHSMHMNYSNDRPDPQMNSQNTQYTMNFGHQGSNPQNTRQPMDLYGSNQRRSDQMDQRGTQENMNYKFQRNYSQMNPQGVRYISPNDGNHRSSGQMDPHITRRPHQGLDHQNTRNPIDFDPRKNPESTQQPLNGTHQRPNFQIGPPNNQNPMNGSNQRFDQPRDQQNARQSTININDAHSIPNPEMNSRDVSNSRIQGTVPPPVYQNTGNPIDVLNDNIRRLQAQIDALRAPPPSDRQPTRCNQRPDPQMIAQNTGHFMNMHGNSQSFASQFLENTRHPLNGSNQRPGAQMDPKNIRKRMNVSNLRTKQTGNQNARQPMYMNNSNQMPDHQINSRTIPPNYSGGLNQGFNSQMTPQSTQNPMNGSNQRPDVTGLQQRPVAQMNHQNTRAQNWNTGNQNSSLYNNSFGSQNSPVLQNHNQNPQIPTAGARSNIDYGRHVENRAENRAENRPVQSQNYGISYQQSGPQARNSNGQQCTFNPMNCSNQQRCQCQSCYWKILLG